MSRIFNWQDRQSWPSEWPRFDCEPDDPQLEPFGQRLKREYKSISCFHGARPIDIDSYYTKGLMLTDYEAIIGKAKKIFSNEIFPPISEPELKQAIKEVGCRDHGRAYVTLDDRNLIEVSGHYLIYGSEFNLAVGAHLPNDRAFKCQQLLKTFGIPTIFNINLPIDYVSPHELNQLARSIGTQQSRVKDPPIIDFTFVLRKAVPGKFVVGHSHPSKIRDFHNNGTIYEWNSNA